jgi:hypothetical protein
MQEEYEWCRDEHVIHRMHPLALMLQRQKELMGFTVPFDPTILGLMQKCLTFELEFESTGIEEAHGGGGGAFFRDTTAVSAKVTLQLNLDDWERGSLKGTGVLEVEDFVHEVLSTDQCTTESQESRNGTLTIDELTFVRSGGIMFFARYDAPAILDVELDYTLEGVESRWSQSCGSDYHWSSGWLPSYLMVYGRAHQAESSPYMAPPRWGTSFTATGWQLAGGELTASKTWSLSGASSTAVSITYEESGAFKLYHRPQ